ncbi:Lrp/AsnC family transcriptional regulator [Comamonas badia]|uniref:Lrp/AsnC family transcriptional regulator n=1 Tax=Comamonas badia TaxID=265291 RepID=UPI0004009327|nr:Lrp/AsnC family transcriptional regulator [Comamonas badia]
MEFSFSPDAIDLRLMDLLQRDATLSNQQLAQRVGVSPATCLRRVARLREGGLIERQVALLSHDALAQWQGHGLAAIVEVSLDRQGAEHLAAFEARAIEEDTVQQCWRVSPGPDFVLVVQVLDMPHYQQLAERLFTQNANVRNVKAFFVTHRAKFDTKMPLAPVGKTQAAINSAKSSGR